MFLKLGNKAKGMSELLQLDSRGLLQLDSLRFLLVSLNNKRATTSAGSAIWSPSWATDLLSDYSARKLRARYSLPRTTMQAPPPLPRPRHPCRHPRTGASLLREDVQLICLASL